MNESQQEVVLGPGEGRSLPVGPTTVRFLAVSDHTGGRSSAEEIIIAAGFEGPPPHIHEVTNHAWYVLEGVPMLTVGKTATEIGPGGFCYVPAGTPHTFANPGSEPARMVQFTTPGGFERYLEELAEAFPAGTAIDRETIVAITARHDTFPA